MCISNTLLPILLISLGAVHIIIPVDAADNNDKILRCYINGVTENIMRKLIVLHIMFRKVCEVVKAANPSFSTYQDFSFSNPTPLLNSSCFDPSKDIVFSTYGFGGINTGPSVNTLFEAHYTRNFNFVHVGWEKGASNASGQIVGYPVAVNNAVNIGKEFGRVVISLVAAGLRLLGVRFVGFSLGAHFMGEAGKEFQTSGQAITLIIGLDPAGPLFFTSIRGLSPRCAVFVLGYHTNSGGMGTTRSVGTVDVWPNCGSPVQEQPACADAERGISISSPKNMCSHNFAFKSYADAILHPDTHIARPASSCKAFNAGNGGNPTIAIDAYIDTSRRGDFYYTTNSELPYGRGESGANPN